MCTPLDRAIVRTSDSTTSALATSPAAWPPIPSETARSTPRSPTSNRAPRDSWARLLSGQIGRRRTRPRFPCGRGPRDPFVAQSVRWIGIATRGGCDTRANGTKGASCPQPGGACARERPGRTAGTSSRWQDRHDRGNMTRGGDSASTWPRRFAEKEPLSSPRRRVLRVHPRQALLRRRAGSLGRSPLGTPRPRRASQDSRVHRRRRPWDDPARRLGWGPRRPCESSDNLSSSTGAPRPAPASTSPCGDGLGLRGPHLRCVPRVAVGGRLHLVRERRRFGRVRTRSAESHRPTSRNSGAYSTCGFQHATR